jgi:hypothetical protein
MGTVAIIGGFLMVWSGLWLTVLVLREMFDGEWVFIMMLPFTLSLGIGGVGLIVYGIGLLNMIVEKTP